MGKVTEIPSTATYTVISSLAALLESLALCHLEYGIVPIAQSVSAWASAQSASVWAAAQSASVWASAQCVIPSVRGFGAAEDSEVAILRICFIHSLG
ncbi:hypothetical protein EPI10_021225 [Gossypium australe]|uniref:Uncharacterized protein n=1 Tax=Gossypium australe TaxID=47621 RepID=A0A5B6WHD1_9ROSI|nr:hypothetical protein EPI10_021225 [Gossypium australe]